MQRVVKVAMAAMTTAVHSSARLRHHSAKPPHSSARLRLRSAKQHLHNNANPFQTKVINLAMMIMLTTIRMVFRFSISA